MEAVSSFTLENLLILNPAGIKAKAAQARAGKPVLGSCLTAAIWVVLAATPTLPNVWTSLTTSLVTTAWGAGLFTVMVAGGLLIVIGGLLIIIGAGGGAAGGAGGWITGQAAPLLKQLRPQLSTP